MNIVSLWFFRSSNEVLAITSKIFRINIEQRNGLLCTWCVLLQLYLVVNDHRFQYKSMDLVEVLSSLHALRQLYELLQNIEDHDIQHINSKNVSTLREWMLTFYAVLVLNVHYFHEGNPNFGSESAKTLQAPLGWCYWEDVPYSFKGILRNKLSFELPVLFFFSFLINKIHILEF